MPAVPKKQSFVASREQSLLGPARVVDIGTGHIQVDVPQPAERVVAIEPRRRGRPTNAEIEARKQAAASVEEKVLPPASTKPPAATLEAEEFPIEFVDMPGPAKQGGVEIPWGKLPAPKKGEKLPSFFIAVERLSPSTVQKKLNREAKALLPREFRAVRIRFNGKLTGTRVFRLK